MGQGLEQPSTKKGLYEHTESDTEWVVVEGGSASGIYALQDSIDEIIYPDDNGEPKAESTIHSEWISRVQFGLEIVFAEQINWFLASNLLWYPVKGLTICRAPNIMLVMGKPSCSPNNLRSYKQWEHNGLGPQVVFEISSQWDTASVMAKKFAFYQEYGVEELYVCDPVKWVITGWYKVGNLLVGIGSINTWVSPLLGIKFKQIPGQMIAILHPDGTPFGKPSQVQLDLKEDFLTLKQEKTRANDEKTRADAAETRADDAETRADDEKTRADDAEVQACAEKTRADAAEAQADDEKARADDEKARADDAEAQIKALQEQLARFKS